MRHFESNTNVDINKRYIFPVHIDCKNIVLRMDEYVVSVLLRDVMSLASTSIAGHRKSQRVVVKGINKRILREL